MTDKQSAEAGDVSWDWPILYASQRKSIRVLWWWLVLAEDQRVLCSECGLFAMTPVYSAPHVVVSLTEFHMCLMKHKKNV